VLYGSYLRRGYCPENQWGMLVSPFALIPQTLTLVAALPDGQMTSTVSFIEDGPLKFPIDDIFEEELDRLRQSGRKMAEGGMLGDRREFSSERLGHVLTLYRLAFAYAREDLGLDDIVFAVHPKHAPFYMRHSLATQECETRAFDTVNGSPASLLRMRLDTFVPERLQDDREKEYFFDAEFHRPPLNRRYRLTLQDLRELVPMCRAVGPAETRALRWLRSEIVKEAAGAAGQPAEKAEQEA
jgi:hypothetical protein